MTEVERIIDERILPADFLKEEIRSDFLVDTHRKKIWAIVLDLLIKFDAVCRKHNLKYFLIGGSLLGVIRHQGFIPWDDDIDVGMLREDYERFSAIVEKEFNQPYFWQTPETDQEYLFSFNKLRNSNTTAISKPFRYAEFNQGIFLDVFPFDNGVFEGAEERHNKINLLNLENSAHMRRSNPNPTEADLRRLNQFPYRNPKIVMDEINRIATQFNNHETSHIQLAVCTIYAYHRLIYQKDLFDQIEFKNFEGVLEVPVIGGYDEFLRTTYGNYHDLPPVEERGKWHDSTSFDADLPYWRFQY